MSITDNLLADHKSRSLDVSKAEKVVDEIKAAGGDAIAIGGDVSADEFPDVIVKAAVECVHPFYMVSALSYSAPFFAHLITGSTARSTISSTTVRTA